MTTGPVGRHWRSAACAARSPPAAHPRRSRSAGGGWWSGPIPGSTTSANSVAAPNDGVPALTPTWPWPRPSSSSALCGGQPGTSIAGTPGQDHLGSADLLADALRNRSQARGPRVINYSATLDVPTDTATLLTD